ncbi:MAG: hypothetical protein AAF830_06645 [Pseudomonadota bacterium]
MKIASFAAAVVAATGLAHATSIVAPVAISSPEGSNPGFPIADIINQVGLDAAYTPGVTDFDSYTASTLHDDFDGTGFTNTESNGPQVFTFSLASLTTVDAIAIWNTGSVGAVTSFSLEIDDDTDRSNGVLGTVLAQQALATNSGSQSAQVFAFSEVTSMVFHVVGLSSLAPPDFYGLGEVAFRSASAPVPVPGALPLFIAGIGALAAKRRARK